MDSPEQDMRTVDWNDLDKKKFYSYGITFFMGVRLLLHPPFLIKTKVQVDRTNSSSSSFQVVRETVRSEGIRGLYKGFWISSGTLIFRQVYFTTYEIIRHRLGPGSATYERLGEKRGEVVRNMTAGAGSSSLMQIFSVPLDIISQRMMVHQKGATGGPRGEVSLMAGNNVSIRQTVWEVYKESGLAGFYRGFHISVLQFAPTSAIWWTAYGLYSEAIEDVVKHLPGTDQLSVDQRRVGTQAAAGLCTGTTTVLLTNPLDVLRTRLQVEGRRGDNRTIRSEFRTLMKEDGRMGLLRGIGPQLLAMAPASVLIVTIYELIKRLSRKNPSEMERIQGDPPGREVELETSVHSGSGVAGVVR
ncbi:unnamed protein product [Choristocarpus tenellus]